MQYQFNSVKHTTFVVQLPLEASSCMGMSDLQSSFIRHGSGELDEAYNIVKNSAENCLNVAAFLWNSKVVKR